MRLLTVTPYFESHRGGVEIVAGRIARELQERGVEVRWLASETSSPPEAGSSGLSLATFEAANDSERKLGIPFPVPTPDALRAIMAEVRRCDVVLVHDVLYMTSLISYIASRFFGKPIIVVQHIGRIKYRNVIVRISMMLANAVIARQVLRSVDRVVFISETTAEYFGKVNYVHRPLLLFNGVDTKVFNISTSESGSFKRKFGLAADRSSALFVGRFIERKGIDYFRDLATLYPHIDWLFAGWGPIDPETWNRANVKVFRNLSGAALADLYRACEVFVLPSTGEGFPLVIQEALACGLPVICGSETALADPAATPYLRGVDLNGPRDDVAARLGGVIEEVLASGDSAAERQARFRFACDTYSWDVVGERYLKLLQEVAPAVSENDRSGRVKDPTPRGARGLARPVTP